MIRFFYFTLFIAILLTSCMTNKEMILFSSSKYGNSDIFIMYADGKNQRALTESQNEEWGPTWINEHEISFLRQKDDSIYRLKYNIRTKEESELGHPPNCVLDDKNILYSSSNPYHLYSCENQIFTYDPDQKEFKCITMGLVGIARYPSWSNDGNLILFTSNHLGTNDVFSYDIRTEELTQLTDSNANNERSELSPDGKLLVYSSDHFEKGNQDIVLLDLETGDLQNVSKSSGMELIARFSKNGGKLFYGSNMDGNWEIYSYDLKTKRQERLTFNNEFAGDPRILKK